VNQKNNRLLTPRRIAIALSVILGVVHVILLGWTLQRRSAITELEVSKIALEENLNQLEEINQDELDALQDDLASIEDEVIQLEASFPELGSAFAIYRRVLDIAQSSSVDLLSIGLRNTDIQKTVSGSVLMKGYSLEARGTTIQCLDFIQALENAGAGSLGVEGVNIIPEDDQCSLEISTFGYPPTDQQP
jgi:Tfp pilus assembly protein PilO